MLTQKNNFGFLRLLFAILVIFSHAPEAIDGNRERDLMISVFGTMSLGDLAVDGFFLISGYLILMSYQKSDSFKTYLKKRISRIYPGFILAYLFCLLCVIPLAQSVQFLLSFDLWFWFKSTFRMLTLQEPWVEGIFNTPEPYLNSPMYTIKYEFLCYLVLPMFSYFFKNNLRLYLYLFLITSSLFLLSYSLNINIATPRPLILESNTFLRFFSAFLMGNIFYLARNRIVYEAKYTILSALILLALLFINQLAHVALIILGAYLMFNFALNFDNQFLGNIGIKTDLSYGIYLYAWPIQNLIVQNNPTLSPLALSFMVLTIATILALISWNFIEKPFIRMKTSVKS